VSEDFRNDLVELHEGVRQFCFDLWLSHYATVLKILEGNDCLLMSCEIVF
jgi:hypothetical protein